VIISEIIQWMSKNSGKHNSNVVVAVGLLLLLVFGMTEVVRPFWNADGWSICKKPVKNYCK